MSRRFGLLASNVGLCIFFVLFAAAHIQQLIAQARLSLVLIVAVETVLVVLFLIRNDPDRTWHSWQTWVTTGAGTVFPLLLRPVADASDILLGQIVQVAGMTLQIAAIFSLNRSIGLLPANRGIKSNGLYRIVRHPLYAAYTVVFIGYLINNWSIYNAVIITAGTAIQIIRLKYEESLLFQYPGYAEFAAKTRWRLVPFVW